MQGGMPGLLLNYLIIILYEKMILKAKLATIKMGIFFYFLSLTTVCKISLTQNRLFGKLFI